jgi:putative phage-type endonuclease
MARAAEAREKRRREWLEGRMSGIGGSEASALVGENPYMTNVQLWELKTGRREPEDIGHKPYVRYGVDAEAPLRELFALDFPELDVSYEEFDVARDASRPFVFATLDGRLADRLTGAKGILEIKTTTIMSTTQANKWIGAVPQCHFCQAIWAMHAAGADFAILKAQIKHPPEDGKEAWVETMHYRWDRAEAEVAESLAILLEAGERFWRHVEAGTRPPLILPSI